MPRLSAEAERFDPGPALDDIAIDRSRSIAPQIYDALRARIVDNRLPPGASLSESEIAKFCEISRTPLRAALQQLAGEGLIIVRPQVGSVVAPHDEARLREEMQNPAIAKAFGETYELANALSITGTPSYVVGDEVIFGAQGQEALARSIEAARNCSTSAIC